MEVADLTLVLAKVNNLEHNVSPLSVSLCLSQFNSILEHLDLQQTQLNALKGINFASLATKELVIDNHEFFMQ